MELGFSLYLELIRFGAALLVFFGHMMGLSPAETKLFGTWYIEHDGVVIFFVLSGYVIAYVSATKENNLYTYAVNRMARIYSVAFPALLLALIVECLVWYFDKTQLGPLNFGDAHLSWGHHFLNILRIFFGSALFLNEIRWDNFWAFCNGPYWSLSYEVWYYILFASFFFLTGWRRWAWISLITLFIGVKVMLLFPVWLMGVAIYYLHRGLTVTHKLAILIWLSTIILYFASKFFDPFAQASQLIGRPFALFLHKELYNSSSFAWDYLLGILVSANIFSARYISFGWLIKPRVSAIVKYCASYTFSLYLYQMPFLILWSLIIWPTLVANHVPNYLKIAMIMVLIFGSVIFLGRYTEHKKQVVRKWIKLGFDKWQSVKMRKSSEVMITN